MTREKVRSLKRTLRGNSHAEATPQDKHLAAESALSLLARSIGFGHRRLAVMRLVVAVESGAQVPHEHWLYCARAAQASQDRKLQDLYLLAATAPQGPATNGTLTAPENR